MILLEIKASVFKKSVLLFADPRKLIMISYIDIYL